MQRAGLYESLGRIFEEATGGSEMNCPYNIMKNVPEDCETCFDYNKFWKSCGKVVIKNDV